MYARQLRALNTIDMRDDRCKRRPEIYFDLAYERCDAVSVPESPYGPIALNDITLITGDAHFISISFSKLPRHLIYFSITALYLSPSFIYALPLIKFSRHPRRNAACYRRDFYLIRLE